MVQEFALGQSGEFGHVPQGHFHFHSRPLGLFEK